jgi:hypothetical protein
MSYWKVGDLLPGGSGSNINGINVPECDEQGGGVVDHLNLSTRFMSGSYSDFGWMLRSPYTWRGSLVREGTIGVPDFIGNDNSTYQHDPSIPPGIITHGMAHTIDYTMPCSIILNTSTAITGLLSDILPDAAAKPMYNYGDWDAPDTKEPAAITGATFSLYGVAPTSYAGLKPGKYYLCIDCSSSTFAADMTPLSKKIYRPIFVLDNSYTWNLNLSGFEKVADDAYKFTTGSIVHKDMDYIPQMFNFEFTPNDVDKRLSVFNKVDVPHQGISIIRAADGTDEKLTITFVNITGDDDDDPMGGVVSIAGSSTVTVLDSTTEPITSIRAEVVCPPLFSAAFTSESDKRKYLRVYGTTKSGYTFLMKPSAFTVTKVGSSTYSPGMSITLKIATAAALNSGNAEVTTRVKKV